MTSKLYLEASDLNKIEWWMQVCKSFTKGVWDEGEMICQEKPDEQSEIVFKTTEHFGERVLDSYTDQNNKKFVYN